VVKGALKGERERIIVLAHQTEAMARQKTLRPVEKYLTPPKAKSKDGGADVLAMMRRLAAKQAKG
jgi:hypothetical protein